MADTVLIIVLGGLLGAQSLLLASVLVQCVKHIIELKANPPPIFLPEPEGLEGPEQFGTMQH